MEGERGAKLRLVASMVIFGTIGLFRRGISLPSGTIACARGLVGALYLLAGAKLRHRPADRAAIRRNLKPLLVSGACIGFNWILLFEAYNHTTIAVATLAYYMAPVFVIPASALLLRERVTRGRAVCVAAAVCGMILVSGVADGGAAGIGGLAGPALGLGAAVLYAAVILLNKTFRDIGGADRTMVQLAMAGLVLVPYVLVVERGSAAPPDMRSLALLAVVSVVHTGFAYTLYFGGVSALPAQTVALYSYIDPMTAILLSSLLPDERLTAAGAAGAALILASALLADRMDAFFDRGLDKGGDRI